MNKGQARHVLVTGGAGFIGSHLCDALLAEGAHVICVDNLMSGRRTNLGHLEREPRFTFIEADVIEPLPDAALPQRIDQIYNLACPASPVAYQTDPEHTMLTCVLGARNMLRLAEKHRARFLLSSTSEVYGDPEVHPQHEDYRGHVNPNGPRACYDEGKRAAEALTFDFWRAGRAEIRVARIFNTYGPRMRADDGRVVSNVVNQALAGDDITVYGDGQQTRSFCFADDTVEGLMRLMALEGEEPGPVNIGNPNEKTIRELVDIVMSMTGSRSRIVTMPLPQDDPKRRRPDIGRAERLLAWHPRTSLADGLQATIAWFAAQRDAVARARDAIRASAD